jgi:Outer membrane protein beta-barrel domain
MSKLHRASLLLLFGMILTVPAAAQDSGFYALASFGNADTESRLGPFGLVDGSDNTWQLGAGYAFNDWLSVELSYHDFGEPIGFFGCLPDVLCSPSVDTEDVQIDGWSGQFVGRLPLAWDLSLFGKTGLIGWETSAATPLLRESGDDLIYSVGLHWAANQSIALQASYEEVALDVRNAKFGLMFRF